MADLTGGDFTKFIVINNADINKLPKSVSDEFFNLLHRIQLAIDINRLAQGKEILRHYLVINTDEPYADEIINILKKNGHWGKEINIENDI